RGRGGGVPPDCRPDRGPLGPPARPRRGPEVGLARTDPRECTGLRFRALAGRHGPPRCARRAVPRSMGPERPPLAARRGGFTPHGRSRVVARRRYELPGDLGPASLEARRVFYRETMDYRAAERWMARPPQGDRAYALILGRHSGIYPRRFRSLKNVPLSVDDARGPRDLRPFLTKYLPEGVYYDRNVYTSLAEARRAGIDYAHAWRSRYFLGQELAFDLDPENLDCPIPGDIA